ncbi:MAG: bacillithiol biosynthesis deacetylase BshB1 [Planctomycetota bacterium]
MPVDVLAIGPHPDDVEMTSAGLLVKMKSRGYSTGIVHLTCGELGSRGTPEEREREAAEAAGLIGVDHMEILGVEHGFEDGSVRVTEGTKRRLAEVVRRLRPRLVIAPYPRDPHPDHANAGLVASQAVHFAELRNFDIEGEPHFSGQLVYGMYRTVFEPTFVVDVTDEFEQKKRAVLAYHSQVGPTQEGEKESRLSSPEFMRGWEARHVFYGNMIGRRYGEAYFSEYVIPLADPVAAFDVPQQRRIAVRTLAAGG